jgi:thiamine biosynthesis lipoprotein
MKETRILMGMPVTVNIVDGARQSDIDAVFDYFHYIDQTFSTYKDNSEISRINRGEISTSDWSEDMKTIFALAEQTKKQTLGYFDIVNNQGLYDPSGVVKGWAIWQAARLLARRGFLNFFIDAGGDIQVSGRNEEKKPWSVGIKNPFEKDQVVKTVYLKRGEGIATSGAYERGSHIYNPKKRSQELATITSITVIGPNAYEADRFATAAFAMQDRGIYVIESLPGFEAYAIDARGIATMTGGFEAYAHV